MLVLPSDLTYRQASAPSDVPAPGQGTGDPASAELSALRVSLFARMPRRRLPVESWRDAILAAAGTLSRDGGPSRALDSPGHHQRTLYSKISRRELDRTLMLFDYPDANVHAARRSESITPTQKLFVMNSAFIIEQARKLAHRLQQSAVTDPKRIRNAYALLFARDPEPDEIKLAEAFLHQPANDAGMTAWEQFAQALLATNEMTDVD